MAWSSWRKTDLSCFLNGLRCVLSFILCPELLKLDKNGEVRLLKKVRILFKKRCG